MKTIFNITKYQLNFLGTIYYYKISNNMKQLNNREFAKTFEADQVSSPNQEVKK